MIHILYVPKDKDPLDFYTVAQENNCRQIIHGPSDIINDHLPNYEDVTVVTVPEYLYIDISEKVVEEGRLVSFKLINEFISEIKKEQPVLLEIYRRYEKSDAIAKIEMIYDGLFSYACEYNFDEYGEYLIRVTGESKNDGKITICEDEVIVFRPRPGREEEVFNFDN